MSRVLLGLSGGIAAYKACELIRALRQRGHEVRVIATRNALQFVSELTLQTLSGAPVRSELFSLSDESEISHIELADWADVALIAPASAASIARLAQGLADDLLSTVCLAARAPLVVAPAMNVNMYRHPATQANLDLLGKRGVRIVGPDKGELACGWVGEGRLVVPERLVAEVDRVTSPLDLRGEVVVVTAGPTAEPIDPVRILTNRSSGRMGFALAEDAARRGAEVVLIAGPVALPTPFGVDRVDIETALQMRQAVREALPRSSILILTAAVADYAVAEPSESKIKRERRDRVVLELIQNPDISAEVCREKGSRTVVTFAAETDDVIENAKRKLRGKGCDLVVANDVSRGDIGFDVDYNEVVILGPSPENAVHVPRSPKRDVARAILDRIVEVRRA